MGMFLIKVMKKKPSSTLPYEITKEECIRQCNEISCKIASLVLLYFKYYVPCFCYIYTPAPEKIFSLFYLSVCLSVCPSFCLCVCKTFM